MTRPASPARCGANRQRRKEKEMINMNGKQSSVEAFRDFLLDAWEHPGKIVIFVDGEYADSIHQFFLEHKVDCGPKSEAFVSGLQIYRSRDGQLKLERRGTVYMFDAIISKDQFLPLANGWFFKTFSRKINPN
jgi:hypothetical protein